MDSNKEQLSFKKGDIIFLEGSVVRGIYFICQGKVKVITSGYNGKEQIVRLAGDGHILGHRGYGGEKYPIGAVALENSQICFVDNASIYQTFIQNPKFTYEVMMFYSQELRKTENRIKYLAQMTVREKVAEALIYLIDTFGLDEKKDFLNVVLSRGEISDLAGLNADQVTRVLSEFKLEGFIETDGKMITIIDHNNLKEMIKTYDI